MFERRSMRPPLPLLIGLLLPIILLVGCATERPLMPTPAIYEDPGGEPLFTGLSSTQQQTAINLFYVTDRHGRKLTDDKQIQEISDQLALVIAPTSP